MTRQPSADRGPDMSRDYLTRGGDRVVLDSFKLRNSCGALISFPIAGTVYFKDRPRKRRRVLWTKEGRAFTHRFSRLDLVDLPPVLSAPPCPCADCSGTPIAPFKTAA